MSEDKFIKDIGPEFVKKHSEIKDYDIVTISELKDGDIFWADTSEEYQDLYFKTILKKTKKRTAFGMYSNRGVRFYKPSKNTMNLKVLVKPKQ